MKRLLNSNKFDRIQTKKTITKEERNMLQLWRRRSHIQKLPYAQEKKLGKDKAPTKSKQRNLKVTWSDTSSSEDSESKHIVGMALIATHSGIDDPKSTLSKESDSEWGASSNKSYKVSEISNLP